MYQPGDNVRLQNGLVGRVVRVFHREVAPRTIYDIRFYRGQILFEDWEDRMDIPSDQIRCRVQKVTVWQDVEVGA